MEPPARDRTGDLRGLDWRSPNEPQSGQSLRTERNHRRKGSFSFQGPPDDAGVRGKGSAIIGGKGR